MRRTLATLAALTALASAPGCTVIGYGLGSAASTGPRTRDRATTGALIGFAVDVVAITGLAFLAAQLENQECWAPVCE